MIPHSTFFTVRKIHKSIQGSTYYLAFDLHLDNNYVIKMYPKIIIYLVSGPSVVLQIVCNMFAFFFYFLWSCMCIETKWCGILIDNGIVYVKYKNAYTTKLMVLNTCSWVFPSKLLCGGHDTRPSVLMRWQWKVSCLLLCVYKLSWYWPPILSLFMLHYHNHSMLMYWTPNQIRKWVCPLQN